MPSADARLGRACKRLFGDRPVRFRRSAAPFLLNNTTDDATAGALVRDKRVLQFATPRICLAAREADCLAVKCIYTIYYIRTVYMQLLDHLQ
jgi:hypothetical protein